MPGVSGVSGARHSGSRGTRRPAASPGVGGSCRPGRGPEGPFPYAPEAVAGRSQTTPAAPRGAGSGADQQPRERCQEAGRPRWWGPSVTSQEHRAVRRSDGGLALFLRPTAPVSRHRVCADHNPTITQKNPWNRGEGGRTCPPQRVLSCCHGQAWWSAPSENSLRKAEQTHPFQQVSKGAGPHPSPPQRRRERCVWMSVLTAF